MTTQALEKIHRVRQCAVRRRQAIVDSVAVFERTTGRTATAEDIAASERFAAVQLDLLDLEAVLDAVRDGAQVAETLIRASIDNSPKPLQDLGKLLCGLLDEDQWSAAEKLLLGAAAEVETLKVAFIDSVHRMHSTPQHMLPRGISMFLNADDTFGVGFRGADGQRREVEVTRAMLDAVTAALDAEDARLAALRLPNPRA